MPSSKRSPSSRAYAGRGQVCIWPGGMLWIGAAFEAGAVHAHHALQLSFGDGRPLHFSRGAGTAWTGHLGCLIPADLPHALDATGRRYANILVEPETAEGRALRARAAADAITPLDDAETRAAADRLFGVWAESHDCVRLESAAREVVRRLAGTAAPAPASDPRVLGALEVIRARLDHRVTLTEVARELNLSPSRLRHLFVEEVGLPFRTYVLWQRLQRVVRGLGTESLTHGALAAGFADAAHMTRTFRRMLGFAPSVVERA